MKHPRKQLLPAAFTLMETLLAIALVAMLVSIFLTVFVPARGLIQQSLTKQEADRLVSILRAEMNTVRANEQSLNQQESAPGQYITAFDKGFYWILSSTKPDTSIVIFSYRADTSKPRNEDGTYPSIPANKSVPGQDTFITSIACPMNSSIHKKDIMNAVGPVFLVKLTQIEPSASGEYKLASSPGVISSASSPNKFFSQEGAEWEWGGAIFCRADFYLMTSLNPASYRKRPWSRMGRPVFSANFSFRR